MDIFARDKYKLPPAAELLATPPKLTECKKLGPIIQAHFEDKINFVIGVLKESLDTSANIILSEPRPALERLEELYDYIQVVNNKIYDAFLRAYVQYTFTLNPRYSINDLVYSFVDEYAGGDMDSPSAGEIDAAAFDYRKPEWPQKLEQNTAAQILILRELHEYFYQTHERVSAEMRKINRLIKYGH